MVYGTFPRSLNDSAELPLTICLIIHFDVINLNAKQWKESDKKDGEA